MSARLDAAQGLNRISDAAARELYPAPTDEWAPPVNGDAGEVAMLRPLLARTSLEGAPLRLAYDAARDGWTAAAFHAAVDTFGAALVVAETEGGSVVGGYNPSGASRPYSVCCAFTLHCASPCAVPPRCRSRGPRTCTCTGLTKVMTVAGTRPRIASCLQ